MSPIVIIGFSLCAAACTMLGGLLALKLKTHLPLALAFSAGAVIGVAFFDLLPEAFALRPGDISLTVLAAGVGFFLYAVIDRFAGHDHNCHDQPHRGLIGAASFSTHSLLDGLALGLAFQVGEATGLVVAAAVLAHDFADGLNTVNVVVKNGGSRSFALRWLAVDAAAPLLGAAASLLVRPDPGVLAILLALFCGFFLHIGASGLLPESHRARPRASTTVATLAGAAFLYAVTALVR